AADSDRADAELGDLPRRVMDRARKARILLFFRARGDDDVATFLRELARHVLADASAGTGDDSDAALKLLHRLLLVARIYEDREAHAIAKTITTPRVASRGDAAYYGSAACATGEMRGLSRAR